MRESKFMHNSLGGWANLIQVVGFPLAILALLLGWVQLRKTTQTARTQTLLALDDRLSDFEDVRTQVNHENPEIDQVRLRRYIAAFERVGYALRLQGLPLKTVDQFYGDRFARLVRRDDTRRIVRRHERWGEFYYLWEELHRYKGNKRGLLKPPQQ